MQVAELYELILRMAFESYGVEKYYESVKESPAYIFRVIEDGAAELNEKGASLFPHHTDLSFTTRLHQNQVNGLVVESNDGSWIPVDLHPLSFVVLAGDASIAGPFFHILLPPPPPLFPNKMTFH